MAKSKYPFHVGLYVYSKGTRAGFLRMQRQGIPRPLFRIEDKLATIAKRRYSALVRQLLRDIKHATKDAHVTMDAAPEDESLDDLLDFFEQMGQELKDENQEIANRANMGSAVDSLETAWFNGGDEEVQAGDKIKEAIERTLQQEQDDYLDRLYKDAGSKMQQVLVSFSLDKQKLFNDNMDALRLLYTDNAVQRLTWEEEYIKRAMLKRILRYVNGEDTKLRLDDLTKYAYSRGDQMARLFARDQMQRFNKAVTLATYSSAGVTKVKWVTCQDQRVRDTHKALNGQVFNVDNLPEEIDDYNCRCGLVPVEWADD